MDDLMFWPLVAIHVKNSDTAHRLNWPVPFKPTHTFMFWIVNSKTISFCLILRFDEENTQHFRRKKRKLY